MLRFTRATPVFAAALVLAVLSAWSGNANASIFSWLFGGPDHRQEAQSAARAGNYSTAADLFLRAAGEDEAQKSPGNKAHLLLRAAECAALAKRNDLAARTLDRIDSDDLPEDERERVTLVRVDLGQYENRPNNLLDDLPAPKLNLPLWAASRIWKARALAYFKLGRIAKGVHALVQREVGLLDDNAIASNRKLIWQELSRNATKVSASERSAFDKTTQGWLDLANIMNTYWLGPQQLQRAIAEWEKQYPDHPAIQSVLHQPQQAQNGSGNASQLATAPATAYQPDGKFDHIALLLPLSGPLASIGAAVRDGFFAAYYQHGGNRPVVRIFDAAAASGNIAQLLDKVYASHADAIVGPLAKDSVSALAAQQPRLPVLALNYLDNFHSVDGSASSGFYQFGLLPEDEAQQAAQRAVAQGHLHALVLTPQNPWGSRMFDAFRDAMNALGGSVVDFRFYQPDNSELGPTVSALLHYNAAAARVIDSARDQGKNVDGLPPAIRQDADFIFLAAQPDSARLLLPQLRFYRAGNLPIYATSSIYAGRADAADDSDLNDVQFCDMPWLLTPTAQQADTRSQLERLWPGRPAPLSRLYALGMDAFDLINNLRVTQLGGNQTWEGATGSLQREVGNRLHRTLEWARFVNGLAVPEASNAASLPAIATPGNAAVSQP